MTALADKVVMVTGVAKGCGKVLAEGFAADRAKVVGCDTDVDGGRATAAAVRAAGGEMTFVEADVADDTAVAELVATTVRTYGGLDCAVNNAGTEATALIADSDDDVVRPADRRQPQRPAVVSQTRDSRDEGAWRGFDRQHVLGHQ